MTATTISPVRTGRASRPVPPAAARRRPATGDGTLRLTNRGRAVLVLLLLGAVLLAAAVLGHLGGGPATGATGDREVVVQPGQTLWGIAAQVEPGRDTRLAVADLVRRNHLGSAAVQAGQRLAVPAS